MENVVTLTKDNFQEIVMKEGVVLADFWAEWCGPCKMLTPVIGQLATDYDGKAVVAKVNVDEEALLAEKFGVSNIPTVIVFKNGEEAVRSVGFRQKAQLAELLEKQL